MKTIIKLSLLLICLSIIYSGALVAQERPMYLTVTTMHWNPDNKDFKMDDWKALEKEYYDKVTTKNELIMSQTVLMHYFTADNSELLWVTGYSSWENIEKAKERSSELAKEAWPDEGKRKEFFAKRSAYYTRKHSDEIYSTMEGAKLPTVKATEPLVYYVRKSHWAYPQDGNVEEAKALMNEYRENVINKNTYIRAYYPSRHAWGSDGRDFMEAFVVGSLGDLESSFEENQKLVKAHWPDEKQADEFFDKMDKYLDGWHADYIYRHVPELTK